MSNLLGNNYGLILFAVVVFILVVLFLSKITKKYCQAKVYNLIKNNFIQSNNKTNLLNNLKDMPRLSEIIKRNDVQLIYYSVKNLEKLNSIAWVHNYVEFKGDKEINSTVSNKEKQKLNDLQIEYANIKFDKYYIEHLNSEISKIIGEKHSYEILSNNLENYNGFISFCIEYLNDKYNKPIVFANSNLEKLHNKIIEEKKIFDLILLNFNEYKKHYENNQTIQRLNSIIKFCF